MLFVVERCCLLCGVVVCCAVCVSLFVVGCLLCVVCLMLVVRCRWWLFFVVVCRCLTFVVRCCLLCVVVCCLLVGVVVCCWCCGLFVGARCCFCLLFVVCSVLFGPVFPFCRLLLFVIRCSFGRCLLCVVRFRCSLFDVRCSWLLFGFVCFAGCVWLLVVVCCVLVLLCVCVRCCGCVLDIGGG